MRELKTAFALLFFGLLVGMQPGWAEGLGTQINWHGQKFVAVSVAVPKFKIPGVEYPGVIKPFAADPVEGGYNLSEEVTALARLGKATRNDATAGHAEGWTNFVCSDDVQWDSMEFGHWVVGGAAMPYTKDQPPKGFTTAIDPVFGPFLGTTVWKSESGQFLLVDGILPRGLVRCGNGGIGRPANRRYVFTFNSPEKPSPKQVEDVVRWEMHELKVKTILQMEIDLSLEVHVTVNSNTTVNVTNNIQPAAQPAPQVVYMQPWQTVSFGGIQQEEHGLPLSVEFTPGYSVRQSWPVPGQTVIINGQPCVQPACPQVPAPVPPPPGPPGTQPPGDHTTPPNGGFPPAQNPAGNINGQYAGGNPPAPAGTGIQNANGPGAHPPTVPAP